MAKVKAGKPFKTKKKCCRDKPRCKRCPVVCKRLMKQELAERLDDGRYVLSVHLTKKAHKAARV
jgi:aldehyde:ferredoxin oxidoreductase